MNNIKVANIKCGGCAGRIKSSLEKKGLNGINVDVVNQIVTFDGDAEVAKKVLAKMGYPEAGSRDAHSLAKKVKSYTSCMIGKASK